MTERSQQESDNYYKRISFNKTVYKKIFLTGLALIFVTFLFRNSKSVGNLIALIFGILTPFIIGAAIAFIIKIPLNFLENKFFNKIKSEKFRRHKRTLSILISYILIIVVFSAIMGLVVPQLAESFKGLEKSIPAFAQNTIDKSKEIPFVNRYSDRLQEEYNNLSWKSAFDEVKNFLSNENTSNVVGRALSTVSSIVGGLVTFLIALISSIYILADKERLSYQGERLSFAFFKEKTANKILHVAHILHDNFYGFIKGQLTVALFIGIATGLLCLVIGIPNGATLGVIVGVTDLVPVVGPFIGGAMGFVLTVIEDPTKAVVFIVLVVILQQVESNIVYPKVVGNKVGLPALWTLIAITLGGSLFGVVGMWIFIPLFSTFYVLLKEYTKKRIDEKDIHLAIRKN